MYGSEISSGLRFLRRLKLQVMDNCLAIVLQPATPDNDRNRTIHKQAGKIVGVYGIAQQEGVPEPKLLRERLFA